MIQELTTVFLLAFLTETLVEYFFAGVFEKYNVADYLKYLAAAVGVALCLGYKVDILLQLADLVPVHPVIGQVVTGIIVGRGSNYLNDLADLVRSIPISRVRQAGGRYVTAVGD